MASSGIPNNLLNFMKEELKQYPGPEFRPCAFYDKHLDCIRVQLADCSFYERRLNRFFTVLISNHSDSEYIGLTIKGVQYLFQSLGISKKAPVRLAEIIDIVVRKYPDTAADIIEKKFGEKLRKDEINVDGLEDLPQTI